MADENGKEVLHFLKEWAKRYFKNKDLAERRIKEMSEEKNEVKLHYKDGSYADVFVCESLDDVKSALSKHSEKSFLITINSKRNLDYLFTNWSFFEKIKGFYIIFINPFSIKETKWSLFPYTHAMVTETSALKKGILSMADAVDLIDQKTFADKISKEVE